MKFKNYLFLITILLVVFAASTGIKNLKFKPHNSKVTPIRPNVIFEETFESGHPFSTVSMDHIGNFDYAFKYVKNPVFQGHQAARFEIRDDQPLVKNGKRAEVVIIKGKDLPGKDMWYSFAAYFPSAGYEYDTERDVINQWYQEGTPATSLRTQKDRFLLESGNTVTSRKQFDLAPLTKDTWHEFVLHFIHSFGADGLIEVWHNGQKVLTQKGGNIYNGDMPKWKIGPYKAAFKHGTSMVKRRIIYFDNIRVGNAKASFEEMTSGTKKDNPVARLAH